MLHDSTRRTFLTTAIGTAATLPLLGEEGTPKSSALIQSPNVYKFAIGNLEAWSISDAFFYMGKDLGLMHPKEELPKMKAFMKQEGRSSPHRLPLYANVLVIRSKNETIIFDAGFGGEPNHRKAWLAQGLALAGITPDSVTAAFLSHSHSDHLNGFVTEGKPTFPNAALHYLPEELAFWRSPEPDFSLTLRNKKQLPGMIKAVREHFDILADQLQPLKSGTSIFNDLITIESSPGHTSGHACFRIQSDGQELLHLSDLAHHDLLMFADPSWFIAFDHNPQQAIVTRKKYWKQAAAKHTRCYGFHLPWPGLGRIIKQAPGYRWAPEPWTW